MLEEAAQSGSVAVERQLQIYLAGREGRQGAVPISPFDLEERARAVLPPKAFDYVAGGAGAEETMRANREAFRRWQIVPRMLRGAARCDLSIELFGARLPAPVML